MNLRKQNRTVAAILYAVLSVVIVVVLCLSVFQLMQGEKKGTTPKVPSATQKAESTQATVPSNEQTQAPAQTSETMATPATDATTETDPAQTQPPSAPTSSTVQTFVMPITGGTISKAFSDDIAVFSQTMNDYRIHTGVDIYAPVGTPVVCCADGVIENVWLDPFDGMCIMIDHGNDIRSLYCNLSEELPKTISVGAAIMQGETIGGVGETMAIEQSDTSHLHFEISENDVPVDPVTYLIPSEDDEGYEDE